MFFKPAGQERHTKSRVIDIGIAADEDDIQLTPATLSDIFFSCGYKCMVSSGFTPGNVSQAEIAPVTDQQATTENNHVSGIMLLISINNILYVYIYEYNI